MRLSRVWVLPIAPLIFTLPPVPPIKVNVRLLATRSAFVTSVRAMSAPTGTLPPLVVSTVTFPPSLTGPLIVMV